LSEIIITQQTTVTNSPNLLSDALCVNVIERVYSFTLFGTVIQCNLKWTAHVDQTILSVVYNQSRLKFAATVTKGVKRFSIRRIVFP